MKIFVFNLILTLKLIFLYFAIKIAEFWEPHFNSIINRLNTLLLLELDNNKAKAKAKFSDYYPSSIIKFINKWLWYSNYKIKQCQKDQLTDFITDFINKFKFPAYAWNSLHNAENKKEFKSTSKHLKIVEIKD
jgi:hypothetical protein